MGRKSRGKHTVKPPQTSAYTNKKEMDKLVQKLLNVCVKPTTRKDEWENYMEIQFLVERIRQFQSTKTLPTEDRMKNLPGFKQWLEKHGANLEKVVVEDYGGEFGLGVKATEDLQKGSELISIPYDIMMTSRSAMDSYLGDFIKSRKMLSDMPNVCLALYLHCERHNTESFFKPYIDMLPATYNTTLYFTPQEMEYLKGSSALTVALSQYKSIARQYGIFFNLMHAEKPVPEVEKIPLCARNEFTYDAYRWAVSSVSTRLNRIATMTREEKEELSKDLQPGDREVKDSTLALIPMWDMMNHSLGQITTDADPAQKRCWSYAMKDFAAGDQVTIFYGARSNIDFLVSNGFVAQNNPFDRVEFQLGVSQNDKLYNKKASLLQKLRVKSSGSFHIYAMTDNLPTSPDLLAFLRVFHMNEEDLDSWLSRAIYGRNGLREIYMPHTLEPKEDEKMWKYLENRIELLLRTYKRTPEEEEELLSNPETSEHIKLAVRLHQEARKVLQACHVFCQTFPVDPERYQQAIASNAESEPRVATENHAIHLQTEMAELEHNVSNMVKTMKQNQEGGERDNNDIDIALLNKFAEGCLPDMCDCASHSGNEAMEKTAEPDTQDRPENVMNSK